MDPTSAQRVGAAESEGPPTQRTPASDAPVDPRARALFEEARAAFRQGRLDAAIGGFETVYGICRKPDLLFDIAQAYRLKGDRERAARTYRRYLDESPNSPARAEIEGWLADLNARPAGSAGPGEAAENEGPPERSLKTPPFQVLSTPGPTRASLVVPAEVPPRTKVRRATTVALGGGAVILAASGALLGWRSITASERTSDLFRNGGMWDGAAEANARTGENAMVWSGVSFALAVVLAALTVVSWHFDSSSPIQTDR